MSSEQENKHVDAIYEEYINLHAKSIGTPIQIFILTNILYFIKVLVLFTITDYDKHRLDILTLIFSIIAMTILLVITYFHKK